MPDTVLATGFSGGYLPNDCDCSPEFFRGENFSQGGKDFHHPMENFSTLTAQNKTPEKSHVSAGQRANFNENFEPPYIYKNKNINKKLINSYLPTNNDSLEDLGDLEQNDNSKQAKSQTQDNSPKAESDVRAHSCASESEKGNFDDVVANAKHALTTPPHQRSQTSSAKVQAKNANERVQSQPKHTQANQPNRPKHSQSQQLPEYQICLERKITPLCCEFESQVG